MGEIAVLRQVRRNHVANVRSSVRYDAEALAGSRGPHSRFVPPNVSPRVQRDRQWTHLE